MFGYAEFDQSQFSVTELVIIDALPHGSGIDYDWHISKNTRGRVVCHNGYHFMDEWGSYVGTIDFSFRFDVADADSGRLMFHTTPGGRYWANKLDLGDYLGTMLCELLDEHIERECRYCDGTGRRSIAVLARSRGCTIADAIKTIEQGGRPHDGTTLDCWVCHGTGRLPVKSV